MSQAIGNSEYLREGRETRRFETPVETPVPVRTGVNSAKSVNLSVSTATANAGMVRLMSGEKFEAADKSFASRFNLAAPSCAVGNIDLEWVVGYCQIKSDEASVNANRLQLKQEEDTLKPKHDKVVNQIRLSVDAMQNSESAKELQKILGAVTAAIAVTSAVLSVFTFGIASIAGVAAIASATLAVLGSILSLSGGDEKVMEMFTKWHKGCNSGISDEDAEKFGQQFYAFFGMGVTIAVGVAGGVGGIVNNVTRGVTEGIQMSYKITTATLSFTSSAIESGGNVNAADKNMTATVMQADQRLSEADARQQTVLSDQIASSTNESISKLFEHWCAFDKVIEEVAGAKTQLASSIAEPAV